MFYQILMELFFAACVNETVMLVISTVAVTCILSAFVMVCCAPIQFIACFDAMRFD